MLKIRRSGDRLIFNMGIPIPGKAGLYVETGPTILASDSCYTKPTALLAVADNGYQSCG